MGTKKPKVAGYVPLPVKDALQEFCVKSDISESQALTEILIEYFGLQSVVPQRSVLGLIQSPSLERIKVLESKVLEHASRLSKLEAESTLNTEQKSNSSTGPLMLDLGLEVAPSPSTGLTQQQLADRLSCRSRTIRDNAGDLQKWSARKDPNGIAWKRIGTGKKTRYYPVDH